MLSGIILPKLHALPALPANQHIMNDLTSAGSSRVEILPVSTRANTKI